MSETIYYYLVECAGLLFLAIIFFSLGLLLGWLLWRNCKANAAEVEKENEKLRSEAALLDKDYKKMQDRERATA